MPRAESPARWDDVQDEMHETPRRHARVAASAEPRLSRAHAAGFADAFDLDGAFGAPSRRFDRDGEDGARVIVLERGDAQIDEPAVAIGAPIVTDEDVLSDGRGPGHDELRDLGEPPERDPETGRRMVRISGRPDAAVAPRRLREIEPRRARRGVAERAASRPDRIALYAVLLGLFLVVLAAASSSAHP